MDEKKASSTGTPEKAGGDMTGGKGRRDEVGRSGIYPATGPLPDDADDLPVITPGDINAHRGDAGPGVERNEDLKGAERSPRKGNEMDKPDTDRLAD